MKRILFTAAIAVAMAGPALADPAEGMWKTKPGDDGSFAHVRIYECGAAICGVLEQAFDSSGAPIDSDAAGKRMIWDMAAKGDGSYSGGKIWAPDRDKTYNSKMTLNGNTLAVAGCVAGGLICRSQDWSRVN